MMEMESVCEVENKNDEQDCKYVGRKADKYDSGQNARNNS